MNCRICGEKIDDNVQYCDYCGAKQQVKNFATNEMHSLELDEPKKNKVLHYNQSKKKKLGWIFVLVFLLFVGGIGVRLNKNSKIRPSDKELKKVLEEKAASYILDGEEINSTIISFSVTKGQETSKGHYEAYCEIEFSDEIMNRKEYYILICSYYDKVGWEIDSAYPYENEEIVLKKVPENIIKNKETEYMTIKSDETSYNNEKFSFIYDYFEPQEYYYKEGLAKISGGIICDNDDLFSKTYRWSCNVDSYSDIQYKVNGDLLKGTWLLDEINAHDHLYKITINNIDDENIDWSIQRTYFHNYYYDEPYEDSEYNNGTSSYTIKPEDGGWKVKLTFDIYVGEAYHQMQDGLMFSDNEEKITITFNLVNIDFSEADVHSRMNGYEEYNHYVCGGEIIKSDYVVDAEEEVNIEHLEGHNYIDGTGIQENDYYETSIQPISNGSQGTNNQSTTNGNQGNNNQTIDTYDNSGPDYLSDVGVFDSYRFSFRKSTAEDDLGNVFKNYLVSNPDALMNDLTGYAEIYTNGQYTHLSGRVGHDKYSSYDDACNLTIYVDGVVVYNSQDILRNTEPFNFYIDITNAKFVKFEANGAGGMLIDSITFYKD